MAGIKEILNGRPKHPEDNISCMWVASILFFAGVFWLLIDRSFLTSVRMEALSLFAFVEMARQIQLYNKSIPQSMPEDFLDTA